MTRLILAALAALVLAAGAMLGYTFATTEPASTTLDAPPVVTCAWERYEDGTAALVCDGEVTAVNLPAAVVADIFTPDAQLDPGQVEYQND